MLEDSKAIVKKSSKKGFEKEFYKMKEITIDLMTTSGCHLCDEAMQMFSYLLSTKPDFNNRFKLNQVEISTSDDLIEEYGIRIPVLKYLDKELAWMFTLEELETWLLELPH